MQAQKPKQGFSIPSLDGLRTVSFAIVFLAHARLGAIIPGGFGVTVFFFLSGYLITTLMRREDEKNGHISLKKFYLRRVLRILPPFYIVLVLALAADLTGFLPGRPDPAAFMAQVLHYSNYFIVRHGYDGLVPGTAVYWSLAVEEHFYLLFPGLFLLLARLRLAPAKKAAALVATCLFLLGWRCFLVFGLDVPTARTEIASDTRFDSLLFGCALALYENPALDRSVLPERLWKLGLFPLALGGLAVSFLFRHDDFRETFRYTLQGFCLIPVFVCAVRYPNWGPMGFLNLRAVAFLGELSYSLYLIHQVVLFAVEHNAPALGAFGGGLLALGITLVLALGMHELVEKPCARLRQRLRA